MLTREKKKTVEYLCHFGVWTLLFVTWYLLRVDDFPGKLVAAQVTLVKVLVLALLVYLTNYLLIPRLLYERKYWWFGIVFLVLVTGAGFFKIYLIIALLQPYFRVHLQVLADLRTKIYDDVIPLFLLVSTGSAGKLVADYIIATKRLAAISREKATAELLYLRSQINPHAVFNTLNTIYFQIDKCNKDARESLLQFAGLLRYQLYECNAETIEIEKELAYLQDYIRLQQKRKDENYQVEFRHAASVCGFRIVPLLLVPFVENAFKHISHFANRPNTICITAEKLDGAFIFSVTNTTEAGEHSGANMEAGGIGLVNVQRRLNLLYTGKHSLEINAADGVYAARLTIDI